MKALEFVATLKNNTILIPENFREELKSSDQKNIRVIVLINDAYGQDYGYRNMVNEEFLRGYDDADSIYDQP